MEVYVVIGYQTWVKQSDVHKKGRHGYYIETVYEQVQVCKDQETADNYSLDFEERGWEVSKHKCLLKDMETYNK